MAHPPIKIPLPADENGCWIWPGYKDAKGYGKFRSTTAYRWVYEELRGPIPEGMQLDHLCRVPACVNPDHLEPVTNAENMRRRYALVTHCANGHEFNEENTRYNRGYRRCRPCDAIRQRKYKQRQKGLAA